MNTTIFLLILVAALLALAANTSTCAPQPPQIVYVQAEAPRNNDIGCLSLIIIGLLLMKVLGWM